MTGSSDLYCFPFWLKRSKHAISGGIFWASFQPFANVRTRSALKHCVRPMHVLRRSALVCLTHDRLPSPTRTKVQPHTHTHSIFGSKTGPPTRWAHSREQKACKRPPQCLSWTHDVCGAFGYFWPMQNLNFAKSEAMTEFAQSMIQSLTRVWQGVVTVWRQMLKFWDSNEKMLMTFTRFQLEVVWHSFMI